MYMSMKDAAGAVKWEDEMLECVRKGGEKKNERIRVCKDRNTWRLICCGHLF